MSRGTFGVILALVMTALANPASGQSLTDKPVSADTCVVELNLLTGATVTVDGRDYGTKRQFTFAPLKPGRLVETKFVAKYPTGESEERTIYLDPGQHLRATLQRPDKSRPELYIQSGHSGGAGRSAFSRDGKFLITSDGPVAILWEVATGRALRTYSAFKNRIDDGIGFDAEGNRIIATSDNTAVVWERDTGRELRKWNVGGCGATQITPDGRGFVTAGYDRDEVTLWDIESGKKLLAFDKQRQANSKCVAFSPDGRLMASGADDHLVILWEMASGRELHRIPKLRLKPSKLAFSPDGKQLVISCYEFETTPQYELVLWDVSNQLQRGTFAAGMDCAVFVDGGRTIATCFNEGEDEKGIVLLDVDRLREVRRIHTSPSIPDRRRFQIQSVSPDGVFFDGRFLREFSDLNCIREFKSSLSSIDDANLIDGGTKVGYTSDDGNLWLWDPLLSSSRQLTTIGQNELIRQWKWIDRTSQIASIVDPNRDRDHDLLITDLAVPGNSRRLSIPTKANYLSIGSVSQDGGTMALLSDGKPILWDLKGGKQLQAFSKNENNLFGGVSLSSDGQWLLAGTEAFDVSSNGVKYRVATLWNTLTAARVRSFEGEGGGALLHPGFVGFTHDMSRVVTAGSRFKEQSQGWIGIWNTKTGALTAEFIGPEQDFKQVVFSDSDKVMAANCRDNSVFIWDVETRRRLRVFPAFRSYSSNPALSHDGRRIMTMLADGSLGLWHILTGDLLCRFVSFNKNQDWLVVTPEGMFDGSPAARQYVSWRIGSGLNVVPVDRFFQDFYRPGLAAEIWRGERPMPEVQIAKTLPPRIKIASPKAGEMDSQTVTIAVEAVDQGGGVSRVAIYQNGARVLAEGENRREGQTLFRSFKMSLVEGKNHFRVTAASGDGSWEAEPAEIVLSYERPLAKSQLHLVAIGVSRYADANLNLEYAAKDAQGMTDLFQRRGKGLYDKVNVTTVTDDQATRDGIKSALKNAVAETRPQDTLVLFLAGHGAMVGQRYFFVPHDLRRKTEQLEDDLRTQGLPADELSDYLGAAKALKRVLILDTCSSGGALQAAVKGRSGFALRGAIERLSRTQGLFTIAAASATEEAKESKELGHGVLSYALLAGMKGVNRGPLEATSVQPSGPDRVVDIMEWFTFAAGQVPRLTEKLYGAAQDVQTSTQGNSFPVLPLDE